MFISMECAFNVVQNSHKRVVNKISNYVFIPCGFHYYCDEAGESKINTWVGFASLFLFSFFLAVTMI